jgi:hypothetical protein
MKTENDEGDEGVIIFEAISGQMMMMMMMKNAIFYSEQDSLELWLYRQ